jgi:uncharacterized protein (DUF885 family)
MRTPIAIFALALSASACTPASSARDAASSGDSATTMKIADDVVDIAFERQPEFPEALRSPRARHDDLPDDSLAGIARRAAREDALLERLRAIDPAKLDARAALAYAVAREKLEGAVALRVCKAELYSANPLYGWQARWPAVAQLQALGTPELREKALARFAKIPAYADSQTANLREGIRLGYVAAKPVVATVIDQLDKLVADPDHSPYLALSQIDGDAAFKGRVEALVRDSITPALARYRDFLANEYMPHALEKPGVDRNPNGAACYRATLRSWTTLDLDPQKVHDTGLAQLASIEAEMKTLAEKRLGAGDPKELLAKLRTEPEYLYKNREEMIELANAAIARAKGAMPRAFHLLPKADVTVQPIPAFQEKSAAAHYMPAALDGSRPATYRIRLFMAEKQSRALGESTAFHEAIPGHHLQTAISNERAEIPDIARFLFNSGYGEGWALYAERLADELGLYSSDLDRLGMLSNAAWRAVRLIVDTGLHALSWDRARAIETMLAHTAVSADQAAAEVDRYIAMPGQATAYMTGYLEIRRLRDRAEKELGARFDLRAFHDRVLENGNVPLPLLEKNIEAWISASRH